MKKYNFTKWERPVEECEQAKQQTKQVAKQIESLNLPKKMIYNVIYAK